MNFIMNNYMIIATALVVLIGLILLLQTKYKSLAAGMLLYLCMTAEDDLGGGGTGPFKFSAVLTWVYDKLPPLAKLLITRKQMNDMIEYAVEQMKLYLLTIKDKETITKTVIPEDE